MWVSGLGIPVGPGLPWIHQPSDKLVESPVHLFTSGLVLMNLEFLVHKRKNKRLDCGMAKILPLKPLS